MFHFLRRNGQNGDQALGTVDVAAPASQRPTVGLALGGGAARGFAHIGVVRTLIARGYTPDIIAGKPIVPGAPNGSPNNPTNCGSMESNPVAIDGVLYTTNAPLGQTFAIDAATGNIIWTYTPSYAGETLPNGTVVLILNLNSVVSRLGKSSVHEELASGASA